MNFDAILENIMKQINLDSEVWRHFGKYFEYKITRYLYKQKDDVSAGALLAV